MLFVGIIFANLLLFFGLLLPSVLNHYQEEIQENMLAKYQYMLEVPTDAISGSKLESLLIADAVFERHERQIIRQQKNSVHTH